MVYGTLKNKNNSKLKKWHLPFILIAILVGLGVLVYSHFHSKKASPVQAQPRPVNSVNYSGPTKQEQQAGNQQKQQDIQRQQLNNTSPAPSQKSASVVIAGTSQNTTTVTVRAFVDNLFEDGGTCTATFTKDGYTTVTQTSTASTGATTTNCQPISIPRTTFSTSGTWQLKVSYTSPDASGASSVKDVTIQ